MCLAFLPSSVLLLATAAYADALPELFNGRDFTGWRVPAENIWFHAADGVLTATSGPEKKGAILWTKQEFGNFVLELEFKMGAGRVDSGIFIRKEQDQIQIGNSGSLNRDMTASPYISGHGYPVEAIGVHEILAPSDWNHLTIVAKGSNYQVWLNGRHVLAYDSETAIERGPLGLQLHPKRQMTIAYRNIRLAELK